VRVPCHYIGVDSAEIRLNGNKSLSIRGLYVNRAVVVCGAIGLNRLQATQSFVVKNMIKDA